MVGRALGLIESQSFDLEDKSAIMLLALAGIEESDAQQRADREQIDRARKLLSEDGALRLRMRSYWIDGGFLEEQPESPLLSILA